MIFWISCGHIKTIDANRSKPSIEVPTPRIVQKIQDKMLADRNLDVLQIVEIIGISDGSENSKLNDHSSQKK